MRHCTAIALSLCAALPAAAAVIPGPFSFSGHATVSHNKLIGSVGPVVDAHGTTQLENLQGSSFAALPEQLGGTYASASTSLLASANHIHMSSSHTAHLTPQGGYVVVDTGVSIGYEFALTQPATISLDASLYATGDFSVGNLLPSIQAVLYDQTDPNNISFFVEDYLPVGWPLQESFFVAPGNYGLTFRIYYQESSFTPKHVDFTSELDLVITTIPAPSALLPAFASAFCLRPSRRRAM